jgi:Zn-dependent M16 (insulinase) family peptidase
MLARPFALTQPLLNFSSFFFFQGDETTTASNMSKKEQEKIEKAERKVQRENQRELIRQQKENFENDSAKMEKEKVTLHPSFLMFSSMTFEPQG